MPVQQIQKGTTYVNYPTVGTSQVTAENLNDHVDNAVLLGGAISGQLDGTPEDADYIVAERSGTLYKYTIAAVKTLFSSITDGFLQISGGTMTGPLVLNSSTPATSATAASKGYVDATTAATIPAGIIGLWGTSVPPAGWLEMNGQSTAGYPSLIALYGTNLPDLRGEFVRGWDNGRGVDTGRSIKSQQTQDIQPHTHSYTVTGSVNSSGQGGTGSGLIPTSSSSTTGSAGSVETRPRNVALMFIIKT